MSAGQWKRDVVMLRNVKAARSEMRYLVTGNAPAMTESRSELPAVRISMTCFAVGGSATGIERAEFFDEICLRSQGLALADLRVAVGAPGLVVWRIERKARRRVLAWRYRRDGAEKCLIIRSMTCSACIAANFPGDGGDHRGQMRRGVTGGTLANGRGSQLQLSDGSSSSFRMAITAPEPRVFTQQWKRRGVHECCRFFEGLERAMARRTVPTVRALVRIAVADSASAENDRFDELRLDRGLICFRVALLADQICVYCRQRKLPDVFKCRRELERL
jgi:hypothetical protein